MLWSNASRATHRNKERCALTWTVTVCWPMLTADALLLPLVASVAVSGAPAKERPHRVLNPCTFWNFMSMFMCKRLLAGWIEAGCAGWIEAGCVSQRAPLARSRPQSTNAVSIDTALAVKVRGRGCVEVLGLGAHGVRTGALGVAGGAGAALHLLQRHDRAQLHAQRLHNPQEPKS